MTNEGKRMRKVKAVTWTLILVGTFVSLSTSPARAQEERCRVEATRSGTQEFWGVVEHEWGHALDGAHGNWHHVTPEWRFDGGRPDSLTCRLSADSVVISFSGLGQVGGAQTQFFVDFAGSSIDEGTYRGQYRFGFEGKDSDRTEQVLDVIVEVQSQTHGLFTVTLEDGGNDPDG
jgi:hypothetical protein